MRVRKAIGPSARMIVGSTQCAGVDRPVDAVQALEALDRGQWEVLVPVRLGVERRSGGRVREEEHDHGHEEHRRNEQEKAPNRVSQHRITGFPPRWDSLPSVYRDTFEKVLDRERAGLVAGPLSVLSGSPRL